MNLSRYKIQMALKKQTWRQRDCQKGTILSEKVSVEVVYFISKYWYMNITSTAFAMVTNAVIVICNTMCVNQYCYIRYWCLFKHYVHVCLSITMTHGSVRLNVHCTSAYRMIEIFRHRWLFHSIVEGRDIGQKSDELWFYGRARYSIASCTDSIASCGIVWSVLGIPWCRESHCWQ